MRGLLIRADELAAAYRKNQCFPCIRLVDVALSCASSFNQVLMQLEKCIAAELFRDTKPDDEAYQSFQRALVQAVEIHVFARKSEPNLLLYRYASCLQAEHEYETSELFELSYELGKLIHQQETLNAIYTVYGRVESAFATSRFHDALIQLGYKAVTLPSDVQKRDFAFREFVVFQKYFPNKENPVMISTVRFIQKEQLYIVPYIYLANLDQHNVLEIERILQNMCPDLFTQDSLYYRVTDNIRYSLISAIMNQLLLESVMEKGKLSADVLFQTEQVIYNFGSDAVSRQFFDTLIHEPKLDVQTINRCLSRIAKSLSVPFGHFEGTNTDWADVSETVDGVVCDKSIAVETANYHRLYGGLTQTMQRRGGKTITLALFLKRVMEKKETGEQPDIQLVLACVLYLIDTGYVATNTAVISNREEQLYVHGLRVSELSLTLEVQRLGRFFNLLAEMERHCLWGWEGMKQQLQDYVCEKHCKSELADRLWRFANCLRNSGQKLSDWQSFYCSVGFPAEPSIIGDAQAYRKWYFTF